MKKTASESFDIRDIYELTLVRDENGNGDTFKLTLKVDGSHREYFIPCFRLYYDYKLSVVESDDKQSNLLDETKKDIVVNINVSGYAQPFISPEYGDKPILCVKAENLDI
jgi:hypothetical protein